MRSGGLIPLVDQTSSYQLEMYSRMNRVGAAVIPREGIPGEGGWGGGSGGSDGRSASEGTGAPGGGRWGGRRDPSLGLDGKETSRGGGSRTRRSVCRRAGFQKNEFFLRFICSGTSIIFLRNDAIYGHTIFQFRSTIF